MKIIFMGTPEFSVNYLDKLIKKFDVIAVYTQPPRKQGRGMKLTKTPVHILAEENNIQVNTANSLKNKEEQKIFKELDADIAIVVSYGLILPKEILEATKYGCINVHASKLPRWRGASPIHHAIMHNDKETAIDIIKMDQGLDTGDIINRFIIPLDNQIKFQELHDIMSNKGSDFLIETLDNFDNYINNSYSQDIEGVKYAHKLTKENGVLDWSLPAIDIYNLGRSLDSNVGIYSYYNDIKIIFFDFEIIDSTTKNEKHGFIIDGEFTISCRIGSVRPKYVKVAGRKKMLVKDFLNGFTISHDIKLKSNV